MGLFLATVKTNIWKNNIRLEKGMSVEFISQYSAPLSTNGGKEVIDAFMRKYGVDIAKANIVSSSYIDVKKIN
jgi:hypothetical protein